MNINTNLCPTSYIIISCQIIKNNIHPYIKNKYPLYNKLDLDTKMNVIYDAYAYTFPHAFLYNENKQ